MMLAIEPTAPATMKPITILRSLALAVWACAAASAPVAAANSEPAAFAGILAAHNQPRVALGLRPLRWSDEAAAVAQGWANTLATQSCRASYNPDPVRRERYGENVLRAYRSEPYQGWQRTPAEVVSRWEAEGRNYDHATHRCLDQGGTQCGQYLQMIWEETEVVGCGRARCEAAEVWVCNYTPRGLQEGLKPYGKPAPTPEPQVEVSALECRAVGPGIDLPAD